MDALWQDVRFGLRMLLKNRTLACIAIATLALGVAANTTVFSAVDNLLLRPLPFPSPDRIVMIWERDAEGGRSNTGFQTFDEWRKESRSFSRMAAISSWTPALVTPGHAEVLNGFRVSSELFDLLGVRLELGRGFLPSEDAPGRNLQAVIGHDLWVRSFGGDRGIIGKTATLGSRAFTIVGVLPRNVPSVFSFSPSKPADIYAPLGYDATLPQACRTCRHLRVVGRLADGVTLAQARDELDRLTHAQVARYPTEYPSAGALLVTLPEYVVGDVRTLLLSLLGAVGFFLLIACVNVAILMLGWATGRQREVAIRVALGAARPRLMRQFLVESLILSAAGGAVGWVLAGFAVAAINTRLFDLPLASTVALDGRVLAFTTVVSLLCGVGFGLVPAVRATQIDLNDALKESGKGASQAERQRLRNVLIAADVSLALVLLTGAGLMSRSFTRLLSVAPGFDVSRGLAFDVSLWGPSFTGPNADRNVARYYTEVLRRVRALPGVEAAGITSQLPLSGNLDMYGIHPKDRPNANPELDPSADRYSVSSGYLQAMRIPLLSGRAFTDGDVEGAPPVALVNETLARTLWPREDPLGKHFAVGDVKSGSRTVVGVVADVLHASLQAPHTPQVYLPAAQWTDTDATVVVRTRGDPRAALRGVRQEIISVDATQPVSSGVTMEDVLATSVRQRRLTMLLFALFAGLALVVAAVGIYGLISYAVAQRTREIGIRMALGAARADVVRMVVWTGMKPVLAGVSIGIGSALALSRTLSSLLFQVKPEDPVTYALGAAVMVVVAWLSCYLPGRLATRVDPLSALRSD
jgi:putative ABC transport system permease protein